MIFLPIISFRILSVRAIYLSNRVQRSYLIKKKSFIYSFKFYIFYLIIICTSSSHDNRNWKRQLSLGLVLVIFFKRRTPSILFTLLLSYCLLCFVALVLCYTFYTFRQLCVLIGQLPSLFLFVYLQDHLTFSFISMIFSGPLKGFHPNLVVLLLICLSLD